MVVESNPKIKEVPKKSYASIVMDMKESAVMLSSPVPALRRSVAKIQEQQVNLSPASASATETPVSGSDSMENADGYSVYISGLPLNAVPALLEDEFKKFGHVKCDGIQVRSNKQGFCFGFVEFEVASAVQKAIEGVAFCHGHGVLHKDLKPCNLLMDQNTMRLKIEDLAFTRAFTLPIKKYTQELLTMWNGALEIFGDYPLLITRHLVS
ncbi:nuclear transport factor 2-like [Actinidia eriantha]|uniref:nuclear transport factor 2-like n=1 Tax=Actinidia eriantha TaxID=165200 RepID=UPI00258DB40A|nr:nuclear transport factor 2-like [Actinidia eriantha]XP_057510136.1 nuclear transport factor 2-like [Actinidia eriantha]